MTEVSLSSHTVQGARKNPLIISPNLDALLDFDERARNVSCPNSPNLPGSFDAQVGLPPPPRGPRKLRSPTVVTRPLHAPHETGTGVAADLSISNPYINPAPTLDVVLKAEKEPVQMISPAPFIIPQDNPINFDSIKWEPRGQSQKYLLSADTRTSDSKQATLGMRHHHVQASLDSRKEHERKLNSSAPHRAATLPSNFPGRPRRKGRPQRLKDSLPIPMIEVRKANKQTTATIINDVPLGGATNGAGSGGLPLMESAEPRWPLLSHDRRNTNSTLSLSTRTETTHEPASSTADEPRISISSTIYTQSQSSHTHSFYSQQHNNPPTFIPELMSSRLYAGHRDTQNRRRSFIDITAKRDPDFPQKTLYSNRIGDSSQPNLNTTALMESEQSQANTSGDAISKPLPSSDTLSRKPSIPSTPKPHFNRSPGQLSSMKPDLSNDTLPPTTNFLKPDDRAELIKRSRKLTQVFGKTPGAESFAPQHDEYLSFLIIPSVQQGQQGTTMSKDLQTSQNRSPVWPPPEGTRYITGNGRRHSTPLTPDEFSFLAHSTDDEISLRMGSRTETRTQSVISSDPRSTDGNGLPITSFIDLSDDNSSITSKKHTKRRAGASSPSGSSFFENKTPEELAEAERRRKREKLARVHRFLGSHVPTDLVLGRGPATTLPGTMPERIPLNMLAEHEVEVCKDWMRRRSNSVAASPNSWSDDVDRLKEDLNGREKAINVRRAVKMEKVFGVQPPQTLYHTRQSASPSAPSIVLSSIEPSRNHNQSAYSKLRIRKTNRPGTSESNKQLLPDRDGDHLEDHRAELQNRENSNVYKHYQYSLISLNDILDRDDRESLAELHQYLQHGDLSALQEFGRRTSASIKSERRRSLPTRSSLLSLASEYTITSITSPKPEMTDFELRRRRAAKLTQFFGVDYRTLIKDVLESIEKGVEDERIGGALNTAEAEDLLQNLRRLRAKREGGFLRQ